MANNYIALHVKSIERRYAKPVTDADKTLTASGHTLSEKFGFIKFAFKTGTGVNRMTADLELELVSNAVTPGAVLGSERRHLAEEVLHLLPDERRGVEVDAAARVHPPLNDRHHGPVADGRRLLGVARGGREDQGEIGTVRGSDGRRVVAVAVGNRRQRRRNRLTRRRRDRVAIRRRVLDTD